MPTSCDDPYGAFNYIVAQSDGILGGFSDVTGLDPDVAYVDYRNDRERVDTVRTIARTPPPGVTLKRGVVDSDLLQWLTADGIADARSITITLLDETRQPVATFTLHNARPTKHVRGAPRATRGSDKVAIEELHLEYEGLELS